MTSRQQMMPARKYPSASQRPPKSSQMMLSSVFMASLSPASRRFGSGVGPDQSLIFGPFLGISLLDHGRFDVDLDLVADEQSARLEGGIPGQAEFLAADV